MIGAPPRMDPEQTARKLQLELWDRQCALWPGENVTPLDVCNPWVAAKYLGYEVQEGWLSSDGTRRGFQLGGFINRPARLIAISDEQNQRSKLFTLAHEVGQAKRFGGHHFDALSDLFQVSPTTMAIRLRQTGLVFR